MFLLFSLLGPVFCLLCNHLFKATLSNNEYDLALNNLREIT